MRRHIPELDGLRAVAVLLVVFFHVGYLHSGYLGVDIFFALSGYLITTILLREHREGRWSLRRFYLRRARRLYPALILVLIVTLPFGTRLANTTPHYLATVTVAGTYFSDFVANHDFSWMGGLAHTWSLSVEEQFYLLWPLVLLLVLRRGARRWLYPVLMLTATAGIAILVARSAYFLPFSRGAELCFGCLLALFLEHREVKRSGLLAGVSSGILVALVILAPPAPLDAGDRTMALSMAGAAIAATGLVASLLDGGGLVGRVLSLKPLVWLGERSYGIYLWQFPIVYGLTGTWGTDPSLPVLGLTLFGSIALAAVSARFVESRFRHRSVPSMRVAEPAPAVG